MKLSHIHTLSPLRRAIVISSAVCLLGLAPAMATETQTASLPKVYQGLGMSSDQPVQIESEQLEVQQDQQKALFSGHVIARQGATVLKSDKLIVFYTGSVAGGQATTTPQQQQQIRRLEAAGNVLVTSGEQTASGENAVFDTAANTIVLTGNVVLTQGENVIRGARLNIDVNTNQAKMEGGRVQMLITPKSLQNNN